MDVWNGMVLCLNYGKKCKGLTFNIGPKTVTLKAQVHGKPKFTIGIVTFVKNEYSDALMIKDVGGCAPELVSSIQIKFKKCY